MENPSRKNPKPIKEVSTIKGNIKKLEQSELGRKRASKALGQSEEYFKAIIQNSSDIIFVVDKLGVITHASPSVEHVLGYRPDELIGKSALSMIASNDRPRAIADFAKALLVKEELIPNVFCIKHKNGTERILEGIGNNLLDNPTVAGFVMNVRDITERKRAEEEKRSLEERLHRAEKMEAIGTLAGSVAHDLNNLLGVLIGNAEILTLNMRKKDPRRPLVEAIMDSGQRAAAEVQDLLTMARRGVVLRELASLNRIVTDLLKTSEIKKMLSSHPHVTVETQCNRDLLDISASAIHIERALTNLIMNALHAIPEKGAITIRTENRYLESPFIGYEEVPKGEYAVLSISDTGSGILPEHMKHLFEPFYMRKVLNKGGTGRGLSVIWGALKDHNGYIDVTSDPGKGTIITLYFPATRDELIRGRNWIQNRSRHSTVQTAFIDPQGGSSA